MAESDNDSVMLARRRTTATLAALAAALVTAGAAHSQARPETPACGHDYYRNVSGHCVHRPASSPAGATARCRDATFSYSQHASGTCSHHGGVAVWLHHP